MANLFDMHEKYHCLKPQVMFSIASLCAWQDHFICTIISIGIPNQGQSTKMNFSNDMKSDNSCFYMLYRVICLGEIVRIIYFEYIYIVTR
jgi:hypothetical protein